MRNSSFYSAIFPVNLFKNIDKRRVMEDEHSMFGDQNVFDWLVETFRPEELIEIGTWKGHSANYMVDACKKLGLAPRCVCVDTFLGGPEHWILPGSIETLHREMGRPTVYERFLGNVIARGNTENVYPLTADSTVGSEVLRHFAFSADLIFVDGAHDPVSVRKDIMGYYPLLSEKGVMFGDDYQYEPLARTVHECAAELNVSVVVVQRKWVFISENAMKMITRRSDLQIRRSFDGWVHP